MTYLQLLLLLQGTERSRGLPEVTQVSGRFGIHILSCVIPAPLLLSTVDALEKIKSELEKLFPLSPTFLLSS